MSSHKFDIAKRNNPELAELFDKLALYIERQTGSGQEFIIPKLAAAALGLNDGEAFVLLQLLTNSGALSQVFNVYCKRTNMLLATVHSEADLDKVPHCDYCDCDHDPCELKLEIAFEMNHESEGIRRAA